MPSLRRFMGSFGARSILTAGIIVSLMPFAWVTRLDPVFLAVFGAEFVVRLILVGRGGWDGSAEASRLSDERRWRWPSWGRLTALVLDFLALLSFLPLSLGSESTRWLRMLRLSRMLLLVSYWTPLVRDVWSVLARRERARQMVLMGAVVAGLSLAGTVVFENAVSSGAPIDFTGDGEIDTADEQFVAHLWWSFRQIQDPGNMVQSPESIVAVTVSLVLTVAGLMLVSFLIGLGTDVVRELVEISRLRAPGLVGHTVVVNVTTSTRALLFELRGHYRKLLPRGRLSWRWLGELFRVTPRRLRGPQLVVVGHPAEPPDFLRHDELSRLVYRQGTRDPGELARRADVDHAQRVVLLADLESPDPDAETIHNILTLVESMRVEAAHGRAGERARLLIAEVLSESNVPAAEAAIAAAGPGMRSFVVPTERLIALFMACVARRPGVGALLEELLTSRGSEIYTCYFDLSGLAYGPGRAPQLPRSAAACFAFVRDQAQRIAATSRRPVVPVGLLVDADDGTERACVRLNPSRVGNGSGEPARVRGFVAVAPNFTAVRDFSEHLYRAVASPSSSVPLDPLHGVTLRDDSRRSLRRALVAGFRPATVGLLESLLMDQPTLEVLVLVANETERALALDAFDAHNRLLQRGLMTGPHARFPARTDGGLGFVVAGDDDRRTRINVAIGDQSSSRQLMALPRGFGELGTLDLVLLVSRERDDADAYTTKTLMKIDALLEATHASQRVVAEVLDAGLARRLRRHYAEIAREHVYVYSIQELRSYFMFQSVVVPSFELVYGELLGWWGQSFRRLVPASVMTGRCRFAELEAHVFEGHGELLVGCELEADEGQRRLIVGAAGDDGAGTLDLGRLRGVWTIGRASDGAL
ncbi:MAG: hypothetical protein B7733_17505 [Myxococcales bacterium FL481]|nr:MAG: hypothetical protein B7733_17505 [Myxococcales bacterium FL481]